MLHGFGKLIGGGIEYSGQFVSGLKDGKGTLKGPNGRCYEGDFVGNLFHGHGIYLLADGTKYTGMLSFKLLRLGEM
jgi:hypothetical protein